MKDKVVSRKWLYIDIFKQKREDSERACSRGETMNGKGGTDADMRSEIIEILDLECVLCHVNGVQMKAKIPL